MATGAQLSARPSWGRRLVGVEGLRGLAAVSVLVGHVHIHLAPDVSLAGPVDRAMDLLLNGLTLFFTLSGFLLYRPFAAAVMRGGGWPSVRRYAANRALRIYPVYLVVLALVAVVLGVAYTASAPRGQQVEGFGDHVGRLTDPLQLLLNALMVQTLVPSALKTGIGPAWSLTVELAFYVVMPLLAWVAYRSSRRLTRRGRVAWACAPAVLLLLMGVTASLAQDRYLAGLPASEQFYAEWGDTWHAVFARSFLVHGGLFAFGMIAAVLLVLVEQGILTGRRVSLLRAGAIAAVVLAVPVADRVRLDALAWSFGCAALVLVVVLPTRAGRHSFAARLLDLAPFRVTGLVSYSLYLWHVPVIWLLVARGLPVAQGPAGFVRNLVAVFLVSFALSVLTYVAVERPALRLKDRIRPATERLGRPAPQRTASGSPT